MSHLALVEEKCNDIIYVLNYKVTAGKRGRCSELSHAADIPLARASLTVQPSSANWNMDAWLKKTTEPRPFTPFRG